VQPRPREQPDDHEPCEAFDEAVGSEPDERDGARGDARADCDGELDEVPDVAAPGKKARSPLERCAFSRGRSDRRALDGPQLDCRHHGSA
jgi:hypothetical protein